MYNLQTAIHKADAPPPAAAPRRRPPLTEWTLPETSRFFAALERFYEEEGRDFVKISEAVGSTKTPIQVCTSPTQPTSLQAELPGLQIRNFYHKCLSNLRHCYKGTGMAETIAQVRNRPISPQALLCVYACVCSVWY